MKRGWSDRRAYLDEEKIAARAKARADMQRLIESGDEQGYVGYIQRLKPDIALGEIEALIERFREERRKHPSEAWNRP
jgi:hypothetical protein